MFEFMGRFADAGLAIACVPETVLLRRIHAATLMRPDCAAVNGSARAEGSAGPAAPDGAGK
jgi:hypothetical protein